MFQALLTDRKDGQYSTRLLDLEESALPEGDVTVEVHYSTLNYKDALAITGKSPVLRKFPLVPGIDLAGIVTESHHPRYQPGDAVVLNGWGIGENHWGGLAQRARVSGEWLVPLQAPFTLRQAMGIGTAGFTAVLCVLALERQGVKPGDGPVVVTGAAGGVGSIALNLLARLGHEVVAVTGRPQEREFLLGLGASEIVDRASLAAPSKPLERERWAGAVDVVGGQMLANLCAAMKYRGVVAACGLAGGMELPTTVAPFILRGVTLVGVNSVLVPFEERLLAWQRLARDLDRAVLERLIEEIPLAQAIEFAPRVLAGQVRGRTVVALPRS